MAEDVEKVNADLVARDAEGKPYTVRYEAVNAMLLNEFLKEHQGRGSEEARKGGATSETTMKSRGNCKRAGSANPEGERTA